jgi:hypothetical protein
MIFSYTRYEVDESPTNPIDIVYRPEVFIRIIGETSDAYLLALVDTGADETVLPLSLAESIGTRPDGLQTTFAAGVGGHSIELFPGSVELQLLNGSESYRWRAMVSFAKFRDPADECAILGHVAALEFFTATFDGEHQQFSLLPNAKLPALD